MALLVEFFVVFLVFEALSFQNCLIRETSVKHNPDDVESLSSATVQPLVPQKRTLNCVFNTNPGVILRVE